MKNYWSLAITLSLLFHAAMFISPPAFIKSLFKEKPLPEKKKTKEIKITPEKIDKIVKKRRLQELDDKEPAPLPYRENLMANLMKNNTASSLEKPRMSEKNVKEIIFSKIPKNIDKDLRENPAYMTYYRLVRERVRANAFRNYNGDEKGDITVVFVILSSGKLKDVSFEDSFNSSKELEYIVLKSIKESAPFPAFPARLSRYTKLTFSIPIYFKNN